MHEMVDQDTTYFIVVPLLLFHPSLTFWIIKLHHNLKAFFIRVVTKSVFKQSLIIVESFGGIGFRVRVFVEKFGSEEA